jgi:Membrane bound beta barrel domain (DUF5777)
MKNYNKKLSLFLATLCLLMFAAGNLSAQDSTEAPVIKKVKPVKNTFGSVWLMDNQTVMVPIKGTFEFDIQHRFGTVVKGSKDLWGLFAPSNIRLGVNYAPVKNLFVGAGVTKDRMQYDFNAKYAILQQTPGKMPVSVTYFTNLVIDGRDKSNFRYGVHRLSFFHQLMVARKVTDKFSVQVAPSLSWYNNVEGYVDSKGNILPKMKNAHVAIAVLGKYKVTDKMAIIAGLDQPLTQHITNNPRPNVSFGIEMTTSSHAFQVFAGNYYGIVPQSNNFFNQNDYTAGQFLIGFNITRLWNF